LFTTLKVAGQAGLKNPLLVDSLIPQATDFGYAEARRVIRAAMKKPTP
jgi:hypothetical protein